MRESLLLDPVETAASARFTADGDALLEQHLAKICTEVADGVSDIIPPGILDGMLLGGGYGRGEGGVLRCCDGDRPYNDLEFYIFVKGSTLVAEKRFRAALSQLCHDLAPYAGLEVEFKLVSRRTLQSSETSMFFYDLVSGHRRLLGGSNLLERCEHLRRADRIPLHEATRLLMNRCSGLLFSLERLHRANFTGEDSDFVRRNCAKTDLALGDVVLAVLGHYHHSVRRRGELLRNLGELKSVPHYELVLQMHRRGSEFKLHPIQSGAPRTALQARLNAILPVARDIFLWLENRRLGTNFESVETYALSDSDKCPHTPGWRNCLVNVKAFGLSGLRSQPFRYPRRRLLETLPLLLWEPHALRTRELYSHLSARLRKAPSSFADAVSAYSELWHRFQ